MSCSVAYAATFNGEQDVYFLRIGDYDCNSNGVGDADDLGSGDSDDCNDNGIPDECEIAAGTVQDDNAKPAFVPISSPIPEQDRQIERSHDAVAVQVGRAAGAGAPEMPRQPR